MTGLKNVLCSGVTPYRAAAPALCMACCGHLVLSYRQTIDCSDASMFVQLDPAAYSFPSFPSKIILFWLITSHKQFFISLCLKKSTSTKSKYRFSNNSHQGTSIMLVCHILLCQMYWRRTLRACILEQKRMKCRGNKLTLTCTKTN